jgi:hypothetical protein
MLRYAVRVTLAEKYQQPNPVRYEAIGLGMTSDPQEAHLYTKLELAEKKAKSYRNRPTWCSEVDIIPVTVIGLQ